MFFVRTPGAPFKGLENGSFFVPSLDKIIHSSSDPNNPFYATNETIGMINCTGRKAVTDLLLTKALFTFAYLAVFVCSICGNCLVVCVVVRRPKMHTVTDVFIANLALSDLLVCCTSLWLTPTYLYTGQWVWGNGLCIALPLFQGTSIFISTLTLMTIALDRYFVICYRSRNGIPVTLIREHMSMQVCLALILLIWSVSLLLIMPYAAHMRLVRVGEPCNFWLCIEDWRRSEMKSVYGVIIFTLQFMLPFWIIGLSYTRIWFFLNKRQSLVRDSSGELQRRRRLLRMLILMVLLFAICWFPSNFLNVLRDFRLDYYLKPYFSFLLILAHLISMTATAGNPLLYAWMNHAFREEFLRMFPFLVPIFGESSKKRLKISRAGVRQEQLKHKQKVQQGAYCMFEMNGNGMCTANGSAENTTLVINHTNEHQKLSRTKNTSL